ncbi:unnamed protein product [Caenorhabditis sp. 36 PRJEB53466]|nr:unnamed protein product [Caenorhabditis sp. 36 PRJEB53466]
MNRLFLVFFFVLSVSRGAVDREKCAKDVNDRRREVVKSVFQEVQLKEANLGPSARKVVSMRTDYFREKMSYSSQSDSQSIIEMKKARAQGERVRVNNFNQKLDELKDEVPSLQGALATKQETVTEALAYLRDLKRQLNLPLAEDLSPKVARELPVVPGRYPTTPFPTHGPEGPEEPEEPEEEVDVMTVVPIVHPPVFSCWIHTNMDYIRRTMAPEDYQRASDQLGRSLAPKRPWFEAGPSGPPAKQAVPLVGGPFLNAVRLAEVHQNAYMFPFTMPAAYSLNFGTFLNLVNSERKEEEEENCEKEEKKEE